MGNKVQQSVNNMKSLANYIARYTKYNSYNHFDADVNYLCTKRMSIDYQDLIVSFSIFTHPRELHVLTITSDKFLFLPFHIVVKLAKLFFGDENNLLFIDKFFLNRVVYMWGACYQDGKSIPPNQSVRVDRYLDFEFFYFFDRKDVVNIADAWK